VRRLLVLLVLPVLVLTGCGGDGGETSAGSLEDITVEGGTGQAPRVEFEDGFSVQQTQVETLVQGDGAKVAAGDTVNVHYVGLNGRSGQQFESSWERGEPAEFTLGQGLIAGFEKALVGQQVGDRVLVAIPPKDGYGSQGNPQIDARGTDTLIFVIDIEGKALTQAQGQALQPPATVPHLATDGQGLPTEFHARPQTPPAPEQVEVYPVIKGEGPPIENGQTVRMHLLGQVYPDGETFLSSYGQGSPGSVPVGQGQPLPCFDDLVGQPAGSRVILICPPDSAFGPEGNPQAGISGDDALIFAVDLLDAQ
jgi:FKBP-type peptidyl-prolyl cis-trans isomerase